MVEIRNVTEDPTWECAFEKSCLSWRKRKSRQVERRVKVEERAMEVKETWLVWNDCSGRHPLSCQKSINNWKQSTKRVLSKHLIVHKKTSEWTGSLPVPNCCGAQSPAPGRLIKWIEEAVKPSQGLVISRRVSRQQELG